MNREHYFMEQAFAQFGNTSPDEGLPIGAVVVWKGEIVGQGCNLAKMAGDPFRHAEIQAIQNAVAEFQSRAREMESDLTVKKIVKKFLKQCSLYTTLEPCPMCAGAILMFRIQRVVIAAPDPKWGALGTVGRLENFPHVIEVQYSDHPDCLALREMPPREEATKARVWKLGEKFYQKYRE